MKKILVSLAAMMFLFSPMAFGVSYTNSGIWIGTFSGNDKLADVNAALYLYDASYGENYLTLFNKLDPDDVYGKNNFDFDTGTTLTNGITTLESYDKWLSGTWVTSPYYVEFYSVKGGNDFALYLVNPLSDSGTWSTEHIYVGDGKNNPAISHFSSWNGSSVPVPEPATLLLFGAGIAGLALYRRKKS